MSAVVTQSTRICDAAVPRDGKNPQIAESGGESRPPNDLMIQNNPDMFTFGQYTDANRQTNSNANVHKVKIIIDKKIIKL